MKPKILVYCDTTWSIGRVYTGLDIHLKNDFEISYYDWGKTGVHEIKKLIPHFDLFITNLVNIKHFVNDDISPNDLKKMIFSCHGFIEINMIGGYVLPHGPSYAILSNSILQLFPEHMHELLYHTYNGVDPSIFNYIERSGTIETIGWCGAPGVDWKRSNWSQEISDVCKLEFKLAFGLTYDELKEWYNSIDILLINAGPSYFMETGPLPGFEAIASGVLVIGTKVGNFAEIPGPKYETIEEAITIIEELKQNPEKVKQLSLEQYECVKKNWTYEVLADQWKNMYNSVLQKVVNN
jgi:glycosyltransferase involved in cell wall biosynthesis